MTWTKYLVFALGVAALVAITAYAGAGQVVAALQDLRLGGLLIIALIHLPIEVLLGWAWRLSGGDLPTGATPKFVWGRLVRDAASEVLPFSQLGGMVFGIRALHLGGIAAVRAGVSMSVDLVMELCAKLPYFVIGLVATYVILPHAKLFGALVLAPVLLAGAVAIPLTFRNSLVGALERFAIAMSKRWPALGSQDGMKALFDSAFANRRRLAGAFLLHLACWLLGAAETWLTLALMKTPVSAGTALAIDSLIGGLRTFGFLVPASAGVQEASHVVICAIFGIPPARAVALSFARRARDLAIGLPTLGVWQYTEARARLRASTADS